MHVTHFALPSQDPLKQLEMYNIITNPQVPREEQKRQMKKKIPRISGSWNIEKTLVADLTKWWQ